MSSAVTTPAVLVVLGQFCQAPQAVAPSSLLLYATPLATATEFLIEELTATGLMLAAKVNVDGFAKPSFRVADTCIAGGLYATPFTVAALVETFPRESTARTVRVDGPAMFAGPIGILTVPVENSRVLVTFPNETS